MSLSPLHNQPLAAAVAEAHVRYTAARPKSAALHQTAREVMPGGNTRTVLAYAPFPTAMERGEGNRLRDIDGHDYLDLCGEYTAGLFGHSEARIHEALQKAMAKGLSLAAVGRAEAEFALLMCARFPSIDMIRFTNSGTEANLIAISAARAYTGRQKIIVCRGGYHGSVLYFPVAGQSPVTVPFPVVVCDYNDTEDMKEAIYENRADLACVVVEPMLGSGGTIAGTSEFLSAIIETCKEVGALSIFDEVMTSRSAFGGLQSRLGLSPDLTTLGKYVGGGMSFGAFGGRREVMDLFTARASHAGTFNNNVMTMAAGLAAMGEIFIQAEVDRLYDMGERLLSGLNAACAGQILQFTGIGSLATPHFRRGAILSAYVPSEAEELLKELFFFDMLEEGIYLARRGMSALSLPVCEIDLQHYIDATARFLNKRADLLALVDGVA